MFAVDRNTSSPYLTVRFNESNSFTPWYGVNSGNGARAWVNFNGTGTVAIRASANVSSITDNGGQGDYTVNFTTAMPDANYSIMGSASTTSGDVNRGNRFVTLYDGSAPAAGSCRFYTAQSNTAVNRDCIYISLAVFR